MTIAKRNPIEKVCRETSAINLQKSNLRAPRVPLPGC